MLVERIEWAPMLAAGRLLTGEPIQVELETILDSEVTEVDWNDLEVVEKYLAGEPIVDDVRLDTPPPAEPLACACKCSQDGGCYRLAQRQGLMWVKILPGHRTVSAVGCLCQERDCACVVNP